MVILVSDDDKGIREVMEMVLKFEGATVYTATNGLEALNMITSGNIKFDALITDFNMPKMNGDELVTELFSRNINLEKIVMISGRLENSDVLETLSEQYSNLTFLFKPVSPEAIIKKIF